MNPDAEILTVDDLLSLVADANPWGSLSRDADRWLSKADRGQVAPPSTTPSRDSADISEDIAARLREALEDRDGKCFRTEIRNSGVFICGIHQSSIWEEDIEGCIAMESLIELVAKIALSVLRYPDGKLKNITAKAANGSDGLKKYSSWKSMAQPI